MELETPIRIAVVSDREIYRDALSTLLLSQDDFEVSARSDSGIALVTVCRTNPDILLLDYDSAHDKALEILRVTAERVPTCKLILLCDNPRRDGIISLFEAGLRGILAKDAPTAMLFKCIRCVNAGEYWIGRDRIGDLMEYVRQVKESAAPPSNPFGLTVREQDVLRSLLTGASNKEIAQKLEISSQSVRHHLCSIFNKVGVSNRLELGLFVLQNGLFRDLGLPDDQKYLQRSHSTDSLLPN